MSRGKKRDALDKEKVIALLATTDNLTEVSKQTGIPISTIKSWKDNLQGEEKDEFENLRKEKMQQYIDESWENIMLASKILNRKFKRAMDNEEELDFLLEEALKETAGSDRRKALTNAIAGIKLDDISKVSMSMAILYDKQALARGKETSIERQIVKKFEDF